MLAFGKNVLYMTDPKEIQKVYVLKTKKDVELFSYLKDHHIHYVLVDGVVLDRMCKQNHQGIVFERNDFSYSSLESCFDENFVVLLDHLEDPHNFGAIIRTCEAAGVKSVIIPKDRSVQVTDTVIKTSVGTTENVKIIKVTNLVDTVKKLQQNNFFVYASAMDGKNMNEMNFSDKKVLIIGNEGKGVSNLVRKVCDEIVSIPMIGEVNSLNASVAGAILIYKMGGLS